MHSYVVCGVCALQSSSCYAVYDSLGHQSVDLYFFYVEFLTMLFASVWDVVLGQYIDIPKYWSSYLLNTYIHMAHLRIDILRYRNY